MSPGIPQDVIDRIVRETDFVALVNRYTRLEKRGDSYWGLCPFHREKTPSFKVEPGEGLFYCFGCKEGGNIFTFLEMTEGLDFIQALEKLADETGIDLGKYRGQGDGNRGKSLRRLNELATVYFRKCYQKSSGGEKARTYVKNRQISEESQEKWRLGFAPDGWEHFLKFARNRGYEPDTQSKAGLIKPRKSGQGHIDRFRNRLMFPIRDRAGRVIGFGGRALEEDQVPKYLNSPETPLFSKKKCFYGFSQARKPVRQTGEAVIVEGYTDVIMCHQHGFENVLGVLGTALTEHHAGPLSRLCDRVVLVFDPDEAGQKSAERSIEVLLGEGLDIDVAELPEGLDPCDLLTEKGADAFQQVLDGRKGFLEFRLEAAARNHDLDTISGREAAFKDVAEMAMHVKEDPKRDLLVRRMAQELGVSEYSAWKYVSSSMRRNNRSSAVRRHDSEDNNDGDQIVSQEKWWALDVVGFLLVHPEFMDRAVEKVETGGLPESREIELLNTLVDRYKQGGEFTASGFMTSLQQNEMSSLASSAVMAERKKAECSNRALDDRFENYLEFLDDIREEKDLTEISPARRGRDTASSDDETLRAYQQKMKKRDKKNQEQIG